MQAEIPQATILIVKQLYNMMKDKVEEIRKKDIEPALEKHREFLEKYPFRQRPGLIDELNPDDVYNPGSREYFFYYIEHELKGLGAIFVGSSGPWESAKNNLSEFKELLKKLVDDSAPLHEKVDYVDAVAKKLSGWGSDKHIVKKIISLYYPEKAVPIFKTGMLESIIKNLGLWGVVEEQAKGAFKKEYSSLTVGEKFELLNNILLELKNSVDELRGLDNFTYMIFLTQLPRAFVELTGPPPKNHVGKCLWSPAGAGWDLMKDLRPGDIIIHYITDKGI